MFDLDMDGVFDEFLEQLQPTPAVTESKEIKCQLCPGGISDGNCGHGAGW